MKNPNNMNFHYARISALSEFLEMRELTGETPEAMPTGIKAGNKESGSGRDCSDCDTNCNCDCAGPDDPDCDCECDCGGYCQCDCEYSDSW